MCGLYLYVSIWLHDMIFGMSLFFSDIDGGSDEGGRVVEVES